MTDQGKSKEFSLIDEHHKAILAATFIGALSTIRHNDGRITSNPVSFIWNGKEFEVSTLKSRMKLCVFPLEYIP